MKKILLLVTFLTVGNILGGQVWGSHDPDFNFKFESDEESDDSSVRPAPKPVENPYWEGETRESLHHLDVIVSPLRRKFLSDYLAIGNDLANLRNALRRIPADEREGLVNLIIEPTTNLVKGDNYNASSVLMGLIEIKDAAERELLVRLILAPETRLVSEDRRNAREIIDILAKVPATEREGLVRLSLAEETRPLRKALGNATAVIETLSEVPASERVGMVRLITNPEIKVVWFDRGYDPNVIKVLKAVPVAEREPLLRLITAPETRLVSEDRRNAYNLESNTPDVIYALRGVPEAEREALVRLITAPETRLVTDNRVNASYVIKALRGVPADEREALIRLITAPETRLVTDNRGNADRVIQYLRKVPTGELEPFVRLITAPETRLVREDRENADRVIDYLREVPTGELEPFVRLITAPETRLVSVDQGNAHWVINALSWVPSAEREPLVRFILNPETRLVRDDLGNVIDVIEALSSVPAVERRDRVIRARNHMDLPPEHRGFNQRLTQLLETPINAPIPPLGGGMAAAAVQGGYAFGINVHDAGRDDATTAAYRLLLEAQRVLSSSTIQGAYGDFMRALDGLTNESLKRKVRIALGLEAASGGGFGALNDGRITSCGLNTNYQDYIGRLWHFASNYADPLATTPETQAREQENARRSLFGALATSIEADGHLVCNPGKLQRIAVGVLQGRLPGVNIDGSVVEESVRDSVTSASSASSSSESFVNNNLAWQMFETTKPYRTPFTAQTFRERAEAFIGENPRVNAPWLRQEIEDFIKNPLNGLAEEEEGGEATTRSTPNPDNPGAAGSGGRLPRK
jgi:hypothetical protein